MAYIGKVPADVLIDPMVDSAAITDATIVTADIADNAVTSAKLAANSVDSSELIDGSIDNAHLAGSIAINKTLLAGGTGLTLSTNTLNVDAAQTQITSVGTLTSFRSTGIDDNADATAITIDSSENVGIGVTPQAWDTTREALQIGTAGILASRNNANVTYLGNNWYRNTSGADTYIGNDEAIALELHNSGNFYIKTAPSSTGSITWTTPLTVLNTGNVGIGTASPNTLLQVGGTVRGTASIVGTDGASPYLKLDHTATTSGRAYSIYSGGLAAGNFDIYDNTASAARLSIDSSGRVGIGTSSPSLNVAGSTGDIAGTVLHIKDTSARADLTLEGQTGARLDLIDITGGSNTKWLRLSIEGDVGKFHSVNDNGAAFNEDNILVMDLASGNVGVGVSPTQKLEVAGDVRIQDARSLFFKRHGDNYAWRVRNESASNGSTYGFSGSNDLVFEVVSNSQTVATPAVDSHTVYGNSANTLVLKETGNVEFGGDATFAGGIQSKGTNGNNPTGDWYDVKQKFLTYKHDVTSTHVNDGYFSVSHGINRENILGVIPHHYGYAGTNVNNFGITSGFVEKVIMYANATLRVYIGSSVVASDKIYLTMIVEGNTG